MSMYVCLSVVLHGEKQRYKGYHVSRIFSSPLFSISITVSISIGESQLRSALLGFRCAHGHGDRIASISRSAFFRLYTCLSRSQEMNSFMLQSSRITTRTPLVLSAKRRMLDPATAV